MASDKYKRKDRDRLVNAKRTDCSQIFIIFILVFCFDYNIYVLGTNFLVKDI